MLATILANFYERDLHKFIYELSLFKSEENLWKTKGSVKNSCGNLALHIIGGTNYLIGNVLANTGYVRDRDQEFMQKDVPRNELIAGLEAVVFLINQTLIAYTQNQLEAEYPILFDGMKRSKVYVLTQLLSHLNYHLGQVNYLRRVFEDD
jgi:hypothetical protein